MSRTTSTTTVPNFTESAALCIEEATEILSLLKVSVDLTPEEVRDEAVDHLVGMIENFLDNVTNLPVGENYVATPLDPYIETDE